MENEFTISALDENEFSIYFDMSEQELMERGAYIFKSDKSPCYPCRVSLIDAKIGESVLALSYEHNSIGDAYRSSGPIFVRQAAKTAVLEKNEVPEMLRHRQLSVRAYNCQGRMIAAETTMGSEIEVLLFQNFKYNNVQFVHLHNAGPGCFNCAVERA